MDISKTDSEKKDSKSKTKIPPMPKVPSRISGSGIDSAQSKIPKRGVSSARGISVCNSKVNTTKFSKPVVPKNCSTSMLNLNLPKTTSLASSRSCFNSHRSVKSKEQTPRLENTDKISEIKKKTEKALSKRNLQSFEAAKDKLQQYQEQFMCKFNSVKDELPKDEREFKLVCLFKNNEGQLVIKNQPSKIITMCDKKTLEELKSSLKNFAQKKLEAIDLDQLNKSPSNIGDTIQDHENFKQIEEAKTKLQIEQKTFLNEFINEIESLRANDKLKESTGNNELDMKNKSLLDEVNELRTKLEDNQTEFTKAKKNSDQKLSTFKKELEEKNKTQSKIQLEFDELTKKYDCLEKEYSKTKSQSKEASEKLSKKTHELEDINQKLKSCAQTNIKLEAKNKEFEVKTVDLQLKIEKLKIDLNTSSNLDKDFIQEQTLKHTIEMNDLKNELLYAQKEKETLEKEVQTLRNKTINLQKIESSFSELQDKLNQTKKEKENLNETIRDLVEKLETSQNRASATRDVQEEVTRLQKVDNLNNDKIQSLQNELTKAQFQIKKLEEKIVLDGKLLKVRTDLIDSLQAKEKSQKVRLQDLFAEVGEKNNNLQMIKTEVLTKTEEFQKLFSTLSTKQMDITRQEHMIKLLQENNERAQHLRVRQEAKIARLEEEILELKQAISVYQDVVLPNNTLRRNLLIAEACRGDCNDNNLGFYIEERRKKRHIDISVKKYEK